MTDPTSRAHQYNRRRHSWARSNRAGRRGSQRPTSFFRSTTLAAR